MRSLIRLIIIPLVLIVLAVSISLGADLVSQRTALAVDESTTTTVAKSGVSRAPSTTTTTVRSEQSTYLARPETPGVYTTEIAGFGETMVQVATGVAEIVGVGPNPDGPPVQVTSLSEFNERVPNASATLSSVVEQFFTNGGSTALVKGASDASAAAIIAAVGPSVVTGADLLVSADLFSLSEGDWLTAAAAMGRAASVALAIALVDPPATVVSQANASSGSFNALTSLGTGLRERSGSSASSMMVFSSNLVTSSGAIIPVSPAFAGEIAENDANEGFWNDPNGIANTMASVRPQFAATRVEAAALQVTGFDPLMYVPGHGTAVISDRLLSGMSDYLSTKRTLDTIQTTISNGLLSYVFAANDGSTWSAVTQSTSAYLTSLFEQGALQGSNAADSYTVACGLGSTMTATDILNGTMVLSVSVAVDHPGIFDRITLTQQMGS